MWKPNRQSSQPLYMQIADEIKSRISYGEFPPGSILPSERKLAKELEVNRSTVVLAYSELRSLGIVESRTGSGTRVCKHKKSTMPNPTPNWRSYTEGGNFLPNVPFLRRVREALQQDPSLIDFARGELAPDLTPTNEINLISEKQHTSYFGYDNPEGYLPLREALVVFLKNYLGIQTTESSILITSGSQQSLYLITQCLLSPGDAVAIEDPSYIYSLPMFQSAGIRLFRLPVDKEGIKAEDIRFLYRKHKIKMVFVNPNFQNPTGLILSNNRRREILDVVSELGIPIVEDDPFSLTAYDGNFPSTLKSLDENGSVIFIGSFSKILASGLRVGWMVAPHSVINRLADARLQMDLGLSVIPQNITAQFLKSEYFDPHIDHLRKNLQFKRDLLINSLQKELSDIIKFNIPQGGLNLWCKIIPKINDHKLLEESIKRGVIFSPGSIYGSDSGYIRLSYGRTFANEIESGVTKISNALRHIL
ncbi:PLP-dependent aminotransferase family protein [Bacillus toyonensis]|uniref:MocR-like pyridoxine biosynthesis transcription factor PdxR n=1 Tax=Bacillus toyonensis TaxID=155322 RepID=UPI003465CCF5